MNKQRYKSTTLYRLACVSSQLSLIALLSACSDATTEQEIALSAEVTTKPSISAAHLASDDIITLSAAQAYSSGLIASPAPTPVSEQSGKEPNTDTGSQTVIPTATTEENNGTTTNTDTTTTAEAQSGNTTTPELGAATADGQMMFDSVSTAGFKGEVLSDGSVKVSWQKDPTARGYNVYKQAQYIATVFTEEFVDTDIFDESYYYEIQAFDFDENYNYVSTGLTVNVTTTGKTNPDSPVPNENILDGYELVFSDEFNGTELDLSKWNTSYLWGDELVINSEEQHYVDITNKPDFGYNPFSLDGEALTISSIRTPDELKDKAFNQPYLSGVITSYDSFKFTYGYVETRAKLPFGQGLWPAFWLLNAYYVDDKPEIDIMEFIGDNQDVVYHTYHYYDPDGTLRSTDSHPTVGTDFTNGYHTYGVEWLPGTLRFYVDGILRHTVIDSKVSQQDMYIIANTALGGWWPGSPNASTPFPAEYKIDYIRAYQKTDGIMQSDPNAGMPSNLPQWLDVPRASPSHLPPFELWPAGYPERQ